MSDFTTVATRSEMQPGQRKTVRVGETIIALFNLNGEIIAIDATCPHKGGPLGQGVVEGNTVYCPFHGWSFDLYSGACHDFPHQRVDTYSVRLNGEEIQVQLKNNL
jgi:nitrite reductase (NADH) small subunit